MAHTERRVVQQLLLGHELLQAHPFRLNPADTMPAASLILLGLRLLMRAHLLLVLVLQRRVRQSAIRAGHLATTCTARPPRRSSRRARVLLANSSVLANQHQYARKTSGRRDTEPHAALWAVPELSTGGLLAAGAARALHTGKAREKANWRAV